MKWFTSGESGALHSGPDNVETDISKRPPIGEGYNDAFSFALSSKLEAARNVINCYELPYEDEQKVRYFYQNLLNKHLYMDVSYCQYILDLAEKQFSDRRKRYE